MLSITEFDPLRSHYATSKSGRGQHRKYMPYAFTEHGAIMLATVLNSAVAIEASIQVMRAFVKLREILSTHKKLAQKLHALERKIEEQDEKIYTIFEATNSLMTPPEKKRPKIGFGRED